MVPKSSTSRGTKRKSSESVEQESIEPSNASPSPSPSPPPKKAKKEITPKAAVWKDIKKWKKKAGTPISKLPSELLDKIISIDSDLDLRDHLALAETCHFFRTAYRDVVFQVLFQSSVPVSKHLLLPPHLFRVNEKGEILINCDPPMRPPYLFTKMPSFLGPLGRSRHSAMNIFSSSTPLEDGWGVSNDEWEEGEDERMNGVGSWRRELLDALEKERSEFELGLRRDHAKQLVLDIEAWEKKVKKLAGEKASKANFVVGMGPRPTALQDSQVEVEARKVLERQKEVYGDWIDLNSSSSDQTTSRDPWFSPWRAHVSSLVNNVMISKTEAKALFKVSDRELLSLPLKSPAGSVKKYYSKAAVEALALRARGGPVGLAEHKEKLRRKAEKAEETRIANLTRRFVEGYYEGFSE